MRIKISEIKEGSITPIHGTDCFPVKTGSKIYVYRDQCPTPSANSPRQASWKATS
jgi:hypothetical protein